MGNHPTSIQTDRIHAHIPNYVRPIERDHLLCGHRTPGGHSLGTDIVPLQIPHANLKGRTGGYKLLELHQHHAYVEIGHGKSTTTTIFMPTSQEEKRHLYLFPDIHHKRYGTLGVEVGREHVPLL